MADDYQHPDADINCTMRKLDEKIADWERNTGEGTTLIVIPHARGNPIHVSVDGLVQTDGVRVIDYLAHAMRLRGGKL